MSVYQPTVLTQWLMGPKPETAHIYTIKRLQFLHFMLWTDHNHTYQRNTNQWIAAALKVISKLYG